LKYVALASPLGCVSLAQSHAEPLPLLHSEISHTDQILAIGPHFPPVFLGQSRSLVANVSPAAAPWVPHQRISAPREV